MKKVLLGLFLVVSALSFSTERTLSYEDTFLDKKTGIVYAIGEETPYTGIVKNYKIPEGNNVFEGKISFKNGIIDGVVELYYPNGKLAKIGTFKNGETNGIQKDFYENGVLKEERFYKNDKLQGISKSYYPNGKLQIEASFKEDKLDGISKEYDETGKIIDQTTFKDNKQID